MKKLLCVSVFIFALCFSIFSQTDENLNCPVVNVEGPAGVTNPGEIMSFVANLDEKGKSYNIGYTWSVSAGKIIEGQGTPVIKVIQPDAGANITVTVEVKGFPEDCPNTSSETAATIGCGLLDSSDEFSLDARRIDKARLDSFFTELQNNPNDQGYIIERFKSNTSKAVIKQKLAKISSYIKMRGFDPTRITVIHDLADENRTQFFRVPPGATPPTID
ncbi:MAG: hypothetical protein H7Z37_02445 [Pyrinomonadaceae bacterium]|nr:hypothetical protein [Pyrinomonadaceae bacterium]